MAEAVRVATAAQVAMAAARSGAALPEVQWAGASLAAVEVAPRLAQVGRVVLLAAASVAPSALMPAPGRVHRVLARCGFKAALAG